MSWSNRKRGNVHRTQMYTNTNASDLMLKATSVASDLSTVGSPSSQCVKGISHPPKKSVAMSADAVIRLAYSAMKNIENFMELYSVWYPVTSSDSVSGRSNGNRLVSANAVTMNMRKARSSANTNQTDCCCLATTSDSVTFPATSITATRLNPMAIS